MRVMSFSRTVRSISPERPLGCQHFGGILAVDEAEKLDKKTLLILEKKRERELIKATAKGRSS